MIGHFSHKKLLTFLQNMFKSLHIDFSGYCCVWKLSNINAQKYLDVKIYMLDRKNVVREDGDTTVAKCNYYLHWVPFSAIDRMKIPL
jgi:hypothetical protein